jgi:ferredoxin-NADP reductase
VASAPDVIELRVGSIVTEARDVVSVELISPTGGVVPRWAPGAHIDVLIGARLERQYSLCGDPVDDRVLRVAVLLEPQSRGGSKWVHEVLTVGDTVRIREPRNNFQLVDATEYLFIAGGIGITPILPMIAECAARDAPWRLVYGGRRADSMAFTTELRRYAERVQIWPQDELGLIDVDAFIGAPRPGVAIYCCGPGPLLDAVEAATSGWPVQTLHVERFRPKDGALDGPDDGFDVVLDHSGLTIPVAAGQSVLEACRLAGVHIPTSCGEGTCGTCETVVLEGIPDHRDSFLTREEQESGDVMMPCCSRSLTPVLVLDL